MFMTCRASMSWKMSFNVTITIAKSSWILEFGLGSISLISTLSSIMPRQFTYLALQMACAHLSRCYLLEVWQTSTWLCFHQHWWTRTRYVWIECCSSQALLFHHCEMCQVPLCTCSLVFSSWGFPKWEHRHVSYRAWYSGQWEASDFSDSFRFHSMFSSFITYLWGWASPKRLEVYGLSRYIWRILC